MSLTKNQFRKRLALLNIAKIKPQESIDSFATRLLTEKKYIKEIFQFKTTVDAEDLCDMFIHGLPPEFKNFKQNIDDLPSSWNVTGIP